MRVFLAALAAMLLAAPVLAAEGDFPKSPKIGPPEPLPEPVCDTAQASNGAWLQGSWVAPHAKWTFERQPGQSLSWRLERKGSVNEQFGWSEGATVGGPVTTLSACTLRLEGVKEAGGADAFAFDGVLTEDGKIYGFATNKRGQVVRFILRRER